MQIRKIIHNRAILLFALFICSTVLFSQQQDAVIAIDSSLVVKPTAIAVVDIIQSIESVNREIKSTERKLELDSRIIQIDSLFPEYVNYIKTEKTRSDKFVKSNPNRQKIDNLIIKWNGNLNNLKSWESTINQSAKRNVRLLEIVSFNEQTWELTFKYAESEEVPVDVLKSIKSTWGNLKKTKKKILDQNNRLLSLESNINEQKVIVGEIITSLIELKNSGVYNLFHLRHEPLWKASFKTADEFKNKEGQMESISKNLSKISKKIITPEGGIYLYIFIIILIGLLFWFLKKTYVKYAFNEEDGDLQNAKDIVLNHSISSVVFLSLAMAKMFFKDTPTLFDDILIVLALITSIELLQPYMYKRFKKILYFVILFFILDSVKTYFWFPTSQYRIYLLFEVIAIIIITHQFTRPYLKTREMNIGKFGLLLIKSTPIVYFLAIISIISNVLGYTNITDISLKIILQSATTIILFYGVLMTVGAVIIGLIHRYFSIKESFDKNKKLLLEQKALKVIRVLAIIYWILFFLEMIDLLRPLTVSISDYLSEPYKVGSISFTIGSILTFLLILVISYVTTRLISYLFDDDSSLKFLKLPKGVPAAISLVIRYFILAFGIIMALSSLNVDLSKFNLMAGALGLGIGFGLQTVISNFVSGLILVFERPILPGDTVEVNNLLGTVNRIGVRSSTISTFDGAEVVVPNNNLIANDLINWTLSNNIKRVEISVGTTYGSDPNEVLKILVDVAKDHADVLKSPEVLALFSEFGDSSLKFQLRFWVPYEKGLLVKSDISVAIYNKFKEKGIEIPFPQQDIYIKEYPKKNKLS